MDLIKEIEEEHDQQGYLGKDQVIKIITKHQITPDQIQRLIKEVLNVPNGNNVYINMNEARRIANALNGGEHETNKRK